MDFKNFKNHFQYLIIKGLKSKKRNINFKAKILINLQAFNRLRKHGVTGRYKVNETLLKKLDLILIRRSQDSQYCQCKSSTFKVRVGKQSPAVSFNQKDQKNEKFFSGTYIFSFEFIRYERMDN